MYYDLMKLKKEMNIDNYTLKDLSLYFEKYDGYVCEIITSKRKIRFEISVNSLPHLIGLQHAFKSKKSKNEYKGVSGFEKMKNGELTLEKVRNAIKNSESKIPWANIKDRIKLLPMFLNTIEDKTTKLKIRNNKLILRKTYLNGDYFLFKNYFQNCYPMMSLKKIDNERVVLETFMVERDITLLGALEEEKIKSIEWIPPLDITSPIVINKKEKIKL